MPGIKNIETMIKNILSDWDVEEPLPKKFSKTTIPMWNYGTTPVFNIKYCFDIENIEDFLHIEHEPQLFDDYKFVVTKEDSSYTLLLSYENINGKKGHLTSKIVPYLRDLDSIQANTSSQIILPDYFIILLNHYFLNSMDHENKKPFLKLTFMYDDINFKTWRKEFRIFIPDSFNMKEYKLSTGFHYEIIQKKKKVKRLTVQQNNKRIEKERRMYDKAWKI